MWNQRADSRRGGRRSGAEKKEQREQWPSKDPSPVVHKRDAKIPEGSELANMVNKMVARLVAKNDANLALPPS
ncbi:hypothetical protein TNCV_180971 [Trichonephila clavipes]|nr:hypothetical protein TNCV_180971 [Trichonephila clavipes]